MKTYLKPLVFLIGIFVVVGAALAFAASDISALRTQAEDLVYQQSIMGWRSWVFGDSSNQDSLYQKVPLLFTRQSISTVNDSLSKQTDPESKKALKFFKNYLEAEYIGKQTAILWDIYSDLEAELKVQVNGKLVPYRDLEKYLSNAKTSEERAKIAQEEYRIYRLLNDVILKRELEKSHQLVRDLGYPNYLDMVVSYRSFDLINLLAMCEDFLEDTEEKYLELFDQVSKIPRDKFRRSDILHLLGAKDWDSYFKSENLLPTLKRTLKGMGIDVDQQKNLLIQSEDLPKKNPRAVCFAIKVPQDVRISIKPRGGKDDYSSLFHEMGHAEHFANSKTNVWEFQQLGSNAVTEGYAYLFEGLVENSTWIRQNTEMNMKDMDDYARHSAFSNLYMMRRYMSKLIYEVKLHMGEKNPQEIYRKVMSKGYGFDLTEEEALRYLSDVDPLLYSADYVQAFFLQAMLEETLERKFGKVWWTNVKAGDYLKSLYAFGNELSSNELAVKLGYEKISAKALKNKIKHSL